MTLPEVPLVANDPFYDFDSSPLPAYMSEDEFVAACDEDIRAEWIDGRVIVISPGSYRHESLQTWISGLLLAFVGHHRLGVVVGSQLQIRLAAQRRRRVPDILFICEARKDIIRTNHIEGPPDLIVEVVSPDSESRDWREKYLEYQAAGVREYWVIDPASEHLEVYALDANGAYQPIVPGDDRIESTVVPGFWLKPSWLFGDDRPTVNEAQRARGTL